MQKLIFSLMCICALVGMSVNAEENTTEHNESKEETVKSLPFKISQMGVIGEISITENSTAFLVSPPADTFVLRNSLQATDSNSKELPLKVIGQLSIEMVGGQNKLVVKDSFRVMVDRKHTPKENTFINITYTACSASNVCYAPMSQKVFLND